AVEPHKLKTEIDQRNFELVYTHYDFPNDTFSLRPLFDKTQAAVDAGGSNYLGYNYDTDLQKLLNDTLQHRNFNTLSEIQHNIHAHFVETMPFIPLWQLHEHVALAPELFAPDFQADAVFADITEWHF